jgi:hypothetical protein
MSDVEEYIEKCKQTDAEFAEGFESGYSSFKIGVLWKLDKLKKGDWRSLREAQFFFPKTK